MSPSDFGLTSNSVIFIIASCMVWFAGTKIAGYADELAERKSLSKALLGLLMLAGVTSLPEIATSFTAAWNNNADLGVNNLLGSIAMQVAVLAVADALFGREALTSVVPDPIVMLQGALNICLLSLVAIAILVGDKAFFFAGYWSWALCICAAYSFFKLTEVSGRQPWIASSLDESKTGGDKNVTKNYDQAYPLLIVKIVGCAVMILVAGYVVATVGENIANQTGMGSSFFGVAFVAIATSLPEASTVFACVRRKLYTMAISDILGTNILNVVLIFGVDLVASQSPVLAELGQFAAVAALLGALVTGIFLIGLAERSDRTIAKMGTDSAMVLVSYIGGLVLLFTLRVAG